MNDNSKCICSLRCRKSSPQCPSNASAGGSFGTYEPNGPPPQWSAWIRTNHKGASDLWRAQQGGMRSPEPFLGVTASNYATTRQRFILHGKTHLNYSVRDILFPVPSDVPSPTTSSGAPQSAQ